MREFAELKKLVDDGIVDDVESFLYDLAECVGALPKKLEVVDALAADLFQDAGEMRRRFEAHVDALATAKSRGTPPPPRGEVAPPQFTLNKDGGIKTTDPHNVREVLRVEGVSLAFDKFTGKKTVSGLRPDLNGQYTDAATRTVRFLCRDRHGFWPNPDATVSACDEVAALNAFDSLDDYFNALLPHDGVARVDSFFEDYARAGEENDAEVLPLLREYSRCFFLGAVARARDPGHKVDLVPVLEGAQGVGKSSLFRLLTPDESWFSDAITARDKSKDILEKTPGKWICEIPEFAGIRHAEVETLKATLTTVNDECRLAYGREATSRARRFVFGITTNRDEYLKDPTGNRRFGPLRVGAVDLAGVAAVRDLLWAEALARWNAGERPAMRADFYDAHAAHVGGRFEGSEVDDALHVFADKGGKVACLEVYKALGVDLDAPRQRRVAEALKALGWRKVRNGAGGRRFERAPLDWIRGAKNGDWTDARGAARTLPWLKVSPGAVGLDVTGATAAPLNVRPDGLEGVAPVDKGAPHKGPRGLRAMDRDAADAAE